MQIGLRQFDSETVEWFQKAAVSGDYSRSRLARELCEQAQWRNVRGDLCEAQARKILPRLAAALELELPKAQPKPPQSSGELLRYDSAVKIRGALNTLGTVSLEPVSKSDTRLWRSMMCTYHPRGEPRHPGKTLKYWIRSEHFGRLGGISFHAAEWQEYSRDAYIGWNARARVSNLGLAVNNSRFLILPSVRVFGLASCVLRLALGRVAKDWQAVHCERLALVYTYVDAAHSGRSYGEAGWERVGLTSGRMSVDGSAKKLFAAPLCEDWRERLCADEGERFRALGDPHIRADARWSDIEFGASTHPDGRVRKRLLKMGRAWKNEPGESVTRIFLNEAERKAAYRLLSSDKVGMNDILETHRQSTVRRCAMHKVVLSVQDTTGLNFDTLKNSTQGLTKIGGTAKGIYTHAVVALTVGGRPLGVLDIDGEFREKCAQQDDVKESIRWVEGVDTACELSRACGDGTRVISVGDRESDVWEVFEQQRRHRDEVGVLVRCSSARQRKVIADDGKIVDMREHVESLPTVGKHYIEIAAQGGKRARKQRIAKVRLRIARVRMMAPGKSDDTLSVIVVSVKEDKPPAKVSSPLNWLLVCSEGCADAAHANMIRHWYEKRWGIEEFFRVLKSGTRIEDRRFDSADDLRKCLAFDSIIAWREFDHSSDCKA